MQFFEGEELVPQLRAPRLGQLAPDLRQKRPEHEKQPDEAREGGPRLVLQLGWNPET